MMETKKVVKKEEREISGFPAIAASSTHQATRPHQARLHACRKSVT